jgi:valyl-tRNA synthetase
MQEALAALLRLFAPYLPFATEEAWSWLRPGSVHRAAWPTGVETLRVIGGAADQAGEAALAAASGLLGDVRRAKSEAKRTLRTPVARLVVRGPDDWLAAVDAARGDLCAAGYVERLEMQAGEAGPAVIELAPADSAERPAVHEQ